MDNRNLIISILISAFFYWLSIREKQEPATPGTVDATARDSIKGLQSRINSLEIKYTTSPFGI